MSELKNPKSKLEARKHLLEIPFIITLMKLKPDHKESPEMKVCFQKRKWKLIIQIQYFLRVTWKISETPEVNFQLRGGFVLVIFEM